MKSLAVTNGIYFEEPLENLRALFRRYWILACQERDEAAKELWECEVAVEVESVRQYQTNVTDQDIQTLFFQEKRRIQDLNFLSDEISKKLAERGDNRIAVNGAELSSRNHGLRHKEAISQREKPKVEIPKSAGELDLTGMIDAMLDEQRT